MQEHGAYITASAASLVRPIQMFRTMPLQRTASSLAQRCAGVRFRHEHVLLWICIVTCTYCLPNGPCRLLPRINCESGASYDAVVSQLQMGRIDSWASRSCFPYTGTSSKDCTRAAKCTSQLPKGVELVLPDTLYQSLNSLSFVCCTWWWHDHWARGTTSVYN
jgi:hypothetical protein